MHSELNEVSAQALLLEISASRSAATSSNFPSLRRDGAASSYAAEPTASSRLPSDWPGTPAKDMPNSCFQPAKATFKIEVSPAGRQNNPEGHNLGG